LQQTEFAQLMFEKSRPRRATHGVLHSLNSAMRFILFYETSCAE
jgi:hypothetical protein